MCGPEQWLGTTDQTFLFPEKYLKSEKSVRLSSTETRPEGNLLSFSTFLFVQETECVCVCVVCVCVCVCRKQLPKFDNDKVDKEHKSFKM